MTKDQRLNGGAWQFCCESALSGQGVVKLGNENTDTNEVVVADGVRFLRVSKESFDILDEAGHDYDSRGWENISSISDDVTNRTDLASFSLTAPTNGFVIVNASGWAQPYTADKWVDVCIDDASGGDTCDSWDVTMENPSDETSSFVNRNHFALSERYSVGAGTKTYYLKSARESGTATGEIYWNDFWGLFVPTQY